MARITTTKAKALRASWQERAESWRDKIGVAKLLSRLEKCALGEADMKPAEVKAAQILLDRVMPTLSASEITHVKPQQTARALMDRVRELMGDEAHAKLAPDYLPESDDAIRH
jgi:hypothetical protein